jgi:hypothetical protein
MSDTMLIGVLSMPRELREADAMSKMQFDSRVKEACEELTKRADEIDELKRKMSERPETTQDGVCHEDDGCPVEKAVLQREWRELKRKIEELTKQHDRYEILRKLNPQQFAALNERCRTQDLRFDDEVLRLARVWQETKRIDL